MSEGYQRDSDGEAILFLLAVLFIVLKLTGEISWPWLWVLCPIWLPFAFVLAGYVMIIAACLVFGIVVGAVFLISVALMVIAETVESYSRNRKK